LSGIAPPHLRNIVRILTETGLRINKELLSIRKDQLDISNATVWIPDSKTENGVAEVPLTPIAVDAFRSQLSLAGPGDWLFPSPRTIGQHCKSVKRIWRTALRKAEVRILGFTTSVRHTLPASVPEAWQMNG
jgi:integrase